MILRSKQLTCLSDGAYLSDVLSVREENKRFDRACTQDPAQIANNDVLREQIDNLLNELPEREQLIIRMRFGLDGTESAKTLEEVGRECKVTRERIRQIETKALRRLHRQLVVNENYKDLKD